MLVGTKQRMGGGGFSMRQMKWVLALAMCVVLGSSGPVLAAGGFLLGGTAQLDTDPENPKNDVIRIRTDVPPFFGTVSRTVDAKIHELDNMLEFKAWFYVGVMLPPQVPEVGKSCIGGSPRLQLAIDLDGDGHPEGNAFGYFGASPNFTGCPPNTWLYEDFTGAGDILITGQPLLPSSPSDRYPGAPGVPNEELEWDIRQLACAAVPIGVLQKPCVIAPPGLNLAQLHWSGVETVVGLFPKHRVCTVALVDDTFDAPLMSGTAYYDLFSAGKATWTDRSHIAGRGFAKGCDKPDHDDHDEPGDHDKDHDRDDHDDKYDKDRRDRWN
jgi:hypothetical protein